MIRTVTLNTGFDEIITVSDPAEGGVGEVIDRCIQPSGKGVNCARFARALGADVKAYGLIGADARDRFGQALGAEGVGTAFMPVPGRTRTNLTLRHSDGRPATHYRAAGFILDNQEPLEALIECLSVDTEVGDVVSLHGSTPDGLPADTWSRIGDMARRKGVVLLVDVYGEALVRVLNGGSIAACKPNKDEILALPGIAEFPVDGMVRAALQYMAAHGVSVPIVSLGERGVVFMAGGTTWAADLGADPPRMFVGAGDAFMAGMAVAMESGELRPREVVRAGVATAVARVEATSMSGLTWRVRELAPKVRFEGVESV